MAPTIFSNNPYSADQSHILLANDPQLFKDRFILLQNHIYDLKTNMIVHLETMVSMMTSSPKKSNSSKVRISSESTVENSFPATTQPIIHYRTLVRHKVCDLVQDDTTFQWRIVDLSNLNVWRSLPIDHQNEIYIFGNYTFCQLNQVTGTLIIQDIDCFSNRVSIPLHRYVTTSPLAASIDQNKIIQNLYLISEVKMLPKTHSASVTSRENSLLYQNTYILEQASKITLVSIKFFKNQRFNIEIGQSISFEAMKPLVNLFTLPRSTVNSVPSHLRIYTQTVTTSALYNGKYQSKLKLECFLVNIKSLLLKSEFATLAQVLKVSSSGTGLIEPIDRFTDTMGANEPLTHWQQDEKLAKKRNLQLQLFPSKSQARLVTFHSLGDSKKKMIPISHGLGGHYAQLGIRAKSIIGATLKRVHKQIHYILPNRSLLTKSFRGRDLEFVMFSRQFFHTLTDQISKWADLVLTRRLLVGYSTFDIFESRRNNRLIMSLENSKSSLSIEKPPSTSPISVKESNIKGFPTSSKKGSRLNAWSMLIPNITDLNRGRLSDDQTMLKVYVNNKNNQSVQLCVHFSGSNSFDWTSKLVGKSTSTYFPRPQKKIDCFPYQTIPVIQATMESIQNLEKDIDQVYHNIELQIKKNPILTGYWSAWQLWLIPWIKVWRRFFNWALELCRQEICLCISLNRDVLLLDYEDCSFFSSGQEIIDSIKSPELEKVPDFFQKWKYLKTGLENSSSSSAVWGSTNDFLLFNHPENYHSLIKKPKKGNPLKISISESNLSFHKAKHRSSRYTAENSREISSIVSPIPRIPGRASSGYLTEEIFTMKSSISADEEDPKIGWGLEEFTHSSSDNRNFPKFSSTSSLPSPSNSPPSHSLSTTATATTATNSTQELSTMIETEGNFQFSESTESSTESPQVSNVPDTVGAISTTSKEDLENDDKNVAKSNIALLLLDMKKGIFVDSQLSTQDSDNMSPELLKYQDQPVSNQDQILYDPVSLCIIGRLKLDQKNNNTRTISFKPHCENNYNPQKPQNLIIKRNKDIIENDMTIEADLKYLLDEPNENSSTKHGSLHNVDHTSQNHSQMMYEMENRQWEFQLQCFSVEFLKNFCAFCKIGKERYWIIALVVNTTHVSIMCVFQNHLVSGKVLWAKFIPWKKTIKIDHLFVKSSRTNFNSEYEASFGLGGGGVLFSNEEKKNTERVWIIGSFKSEQFIASINILNGEILSSQLVTTANAKNSRAHSQIISRNKKNTLSKKNSFEDCRSTTVQCIPFQLFGSNLSPMVTKP